MPVIQSLSFTRRQVQDFGKLFRTTRKFLGKSQLDVARKAFGYERSHSKISRIERGMNNKVDAFAVDRIARALSLPVDMLTAIDPRFSDRLAVIKTATNHGFWTHRAYAVIDRKTRAQSSRRPAVKDSKPSVKATAAALAPAPSPAKARPSFIREGTLDAADKAHAGRPSQPTRSAQPVGKPAAPTNGQAAEVFTVARKLFVKPGASARARG